MVTPTSCCPREVMVAALLRGTLYDLTSSYEYVDSEATQKIKTEAQKMLQMIDDPQNMELYDDFADALYEKLESVVISVMPLSSAGARSDLWKKYHKIRSTELCDTWDKFLKDLSIEDGIGTSIYTLLTQMINDKMFEELVVHYTSTHTDVAHHNVCKKSLSSLEEGIIRYATGFIPHTLIKRFEARKDKKYALFVDCLLGMSINYEDSVESSFLEYTKRWTNIINRGGLFEINDQSFNFFKEVESTLQMKLQFFMLESAKGIENKSYKDRIISEVTSDEDVLFHWSICAVHIMDEQLSNELLNYIVELWLTIRGFSLANEWLEIFKQKTVSSTKGKGGLRRRLKYKE